MRIAYIILRDDDVVFTIGHCRHVGELLEVIRPYATSLDGLLGTCIEHDHVSMTISLDGAIATFIRHNQAATIVTNIRQILKRMGAMIGRRSNTARVGENDVHYNFAYEMLKASLDIPPEDLRGQGRRIARMIKRF